MNIQVERAGTAPTVPALNLSRLAGRPSINPDKELMMDAFITSAAPRTIARTSNREEADDYAGFVVRLNDDWRVVECSARIQWILQRLRLSNGRVGARWASVAYHRGRETLKVAVTRRCGQIDPDAAEVIDELPAWIEGGRK